MDIQPARREDLAEILAVQKLAFYDQACLYGSFRIRPLLATLEEIEAGWSARRYLKGVEGGRIIASARGKADGDTCHIGNVIVRPDRQGQGLGKAILSALEDLFSEVKRFELFTGALSASNIAFYEKAGYRIYERQAAEGAEPELVFMEKTR
jgi:GNAT superfamily N-acetyltransferase